MARGDFDVWTTAPITPELKQSFYVSDEWIHLEYALLTLSTTPPGSLAGQRIAYNAGRASAETIKRGVPNTQLVPFNSVEEAFQGLCQGSVSGAVFARMVAVEQLLKRPAGCETAALHFELLPQIRQPIAIAGRREHRAIVNRLRAGVSSLAEDGTLAKLLQRTSGVTDRESEFLSALINARRWSRVMQASALVGLVVTLAGAVLLYKLRLARRYAEHAAMMQSRFTAMVSHEIRTPMNGIVGMTELLEDTPLTSEQREFVETIRGSGKALLSIIDSILDFSRAEHEMPAAEEAIFSPALILEETLGVLAAQAHKKEVELACIQDPGLPELVMGDAAGLRQVLLNLVGNGLKFTDRGSVLVRAQLLGVENGRAAVRFSIIDTGIGIPSEAQARLFRPFAQAEPSISRRFGGTGLGLAICQRLLDRMGSAVQLESLPGKGTTVRFDLLWPIAGIKPMERPSLAGRRVLLAGLQGMTHTVLDRHLRSWGVETDLVGQVHSPLVEDYLAVIAEYDQPFLGNVPLILLARHHSENGGSAGNFTLYWPFRPTKLRAILERLVIGPATQRMEPVLPAVRETSQDDEAPAPNILVVDDNPTNRRVAQRLLEKLGYRVTVACGGEEAIAFASEQHFPLVLMDCCMPGVDGFEATARIRAQESSWRRTVIVAMTASAFVEDRERCRTAGMEDYLAKPVDLASLQAVMNRWAPLTRQPIA